MDYVCNLNESYIKIAKNELNEDPINRKGAILKLKEWVEEQPHIQFPTDTTILLMILRYAKFSQLKARDVIENNCMLKTQDWRVFDSYDPREEWVKRFWRDGHIVLLPGRGDRGQRRMLIRPGVHDTNEWKSHTKEYMRAIFMTMYYLLMDEEVQVSGMDHIVDFTGFTVAHQTLLSISETKLFGSHFTNTMPQRIRGFHFYNAGTFGELFLGVFKNFLSKKLQKRFHFLGNNLEKLYKIVPMGCLPREYLPDDYTGPHAGTTEQLIDEFVNNMTSDKTCQFMARLSDPQWGIDMSKKPKDEGLQASFRKLSVN